MVFIAHDLAVVHHVADRIAVMYLGVIVEEGSHAEVHDRPRHPDTKILLAAVPHPDRRAHRSGLAERDVIVLRGEIPSLDPPSGCHFPLT